MDTVTGDDPNDRPANHGRIMVGILAMTAGALLLMERLDLAEVHLTSRLWPFFPLGLGLLRIIDPPQPEDGRHRSRRSGVWLVFIGAWGLVNEFHLWGFSYASSWPLVVIFAGANIVWRAVQEPPRGSKHERRGC